MPRCIYFWRATLTVKLRQGGAQRATFLPVWYVYHDFLAVVSPAALLMSLPKWSVFSQHDRGMNCVLAAIGLSNNTNSSEPDVVGSRTPLYTTLLERVVRGTAKGSVGIRVPMKMAPTVLKRSPRSPYPWTSCNRTEIRSEKVSLKAYSPYPRFSLTLSLAHGVYFRPFCDCVFTKHFSFRR